MAELLFDPMSHRYTVDGVRVPSVTEIIDEMLSTDKRWFRKEHRDRGSRGHSLIRQIAWLEHPSSESEWDESADIPEIIPCGRAFQRFCRETGFEVTNAEQVVYSENLRVIGTLDLVGVLRRMGGRVALIDVKTGTVPPSVELQTAAYKRLLRDHHNQHVEKRYSLKLSADTERGDFQFRECSNATDEGVFIGLVAGYRWKQAHGLLNGRGK